MFTSQLLLVHTCRDLSSQPPVLSVLLVAQHMGLSLRWDLSLLLQQREQTYSVGKLGVSMGVSSCLVVLSHLPQAAGSAVVQRYILRDNMGYNASDTSVTKLPHLLHCSL